MLCKKILNFIAYCLWGKDTEDRTEDTEYIVEAENISKRFELYNYPRHFLGQILFGWIKTFYKEFWALKNVNFTLKRGESLGIIGRNGSGKSTLLQILCGILEPTTGSVKIHGRIAALLELGSGFNPEFSGRDNVYMNGALLGLTKKEIDERFQEIADFADIGDFIDRPVRIYSSGMKVRLAFAVQVMVDPDILIVDEALAVGDALFQQKCFARMERLCQKGCTIILVTHSTQSISRFCQKCLYLKDNKMFYFGETPQGITYYMQHLQEAELQKQSFYDEQNKSDDGNYVYHSSTPEETTWRVGDAKITRIDIQGLEKPNILRAPCLLVIDVYAKWDTNFIQEKIDTNNLTSDIGIEIALTDTRCIIIYGYNTLAHNITINPINQDNLHFTFTIEIPTIMKGNIFLQTTLWLGKNQRIILEQSTHTCQMNSVGVNSQSGLVHFPTICDTNNILLQDNFSGESIDLF